MKYLMPKSQDFIRDHGKVWAHNGAGHYYNQSGTRAQFYGIMGGPSAVVRSRAVQPFPRFLLGDVVKRVFTDGQSQVSD